jgi:hypothetical protein
MIIYDGPSMLDGASIVGIATGNSKNQKTGDMIQTWILLRDTHPSEATSTGADSSICGDCKARPVNNGDCYVTMMAPNSVYRAFKRGSYNMLRTPHEIAEFGRGLKIRIGSYGDPAAVPAYVWENLLKNSVGHTGYTHQWKNPIAASHKHYLMASVDSQQESVSAKSAGWRTFRVVRDPTEIQFDKLEFRCPSDPLLESAHVPCFKCLACDGADISKPRKGNPVIMTHGIRSKKKQNILRNRLNIVVG